MVEDIIYYLILDFKDVINNKTASNLSGSDADAHF